MALLEVRTKKGGTKYIHSFQPGHGILLHTMCKARWQHCTGWKIGNGTADTTKAAKINSSCTLFSRTFAAGNKIKQFYELLVEDSLRREDVDSLSRENMKNLHEIMQSFRFSNVCYWSYLSRMKLSSSLMPHNFSPSSTFKQIKMNL